MNTYHFHAVMHDSGLANTTDRSVDTGAIAPDERIPIFIVTLI